MKFTKNLLMIRASALVISLLVAGSVSAAATPDDGKAPKAVPHQQASGNQAEPRAESLDEEAFVKEENIVGSDVLPMTPPSRWATGEEEEPNC